MINSYHSFRSTCRVCAGNNLHCFLDLGLTPLANSFLSAESEFACELRFPLRVYYCEDCTLVQLSDVIDQDVLFRNYIYVTGTSDTIKAHNRSYAQTVTDMLKLTQDDLVIEIASNDGSLLKFFQSHGVKVLGVEPAENICQLANQSGIPTENIFFDSDTAKILLERFGKARVVIGNNVLAHVNDPVNFLRGFRQLLTKDGLVIVEVPYLRDLVENLEYDTIYHEHLCYFSIAALRYLFSEADLSIIKIDRVEVHGGSLRIFAGLPETFGSHAQEVLVLIELERAQGMHELEHYKEFADSVRSNRQKMQRLLTNLKDQGYTIAAYGAPAKGNTLLNFCNITADAVSFTVDKNPMKIGKYTPGMHLPVLPVQALLDQQPDYALILAWNFADEIIKQQATYLERGGQFILPLPIPRIISGKKS